MAEITWMKVLNYVVLIIVVVFAVLIFAIPFVINQLTFLKKLTEKGWVKGVLEFFYKLYFRVRKLRFLFPKIFRFIRVLFTIDSLSFREIYRKFHLDYLTNLILLIQSPIFVKATLVIALITFTMIILSNYVDHILGTFGFKNISLIFVAILMIGMFVLSMLLLLGTVTSLAFAGSKVKLALVAFIVIVILVLMYMLKGTGLSNPLRYIAIVIVLAGFLAWILKTHHPEVGLQNSNWKLYWISTGRMLFGLFNKMSPTKLIQLSESGVKQQNILYGFRNSFFDVISVYTIGLLLALLVLVYRSVLHKKTEVDADTDQESYEDNNNVIQEMGTLSILISSTILVMLCLFEMQ